LSAPGSGLPQVLTPQYKATVPAGKKSDLTVSFDLLKGYAINKNPPISLKLTPVPGIKFDKTDFTSSPNDPKSTDEYYVDLPTLKVPMIVGKAGKYEVPGKLIYFFCSKADGFCSRQVIDVKVPVTAQ
jgi:hypothetical protein